MWLLGSGLQGTGALLLLSLLIYAQSSDSWSEDTCSGEPSVSSSAPAAVQAPYNGCDLASSCFTSLEQQATFARDSPEYCPACLLRM